jgi:hypothetical protein
MADKTRWATAVVKVGAGRGFVVGNRRERFVVTAGHCLPELPPYHAASYTEERTYGALLGPIDGDQIVCAECLFADPIADIAVLGTPDGQELYDEAQAYEALVGGATPVPIAELTLVRPPITLSTGATMFGRPMAESEGWMLSLDGRWFRCDVTATSRSLWIANAAEAIEGSMSGSPIMDEVGKALGVVCISAEFKTAEGREMGKPREGGPNPLLTACLPGWLLSELSEADEDE